MGTAPWWRRARLAALLLVLALVAAPSAAAVPSNDDFANAETLLGDPVSAPGDNTSATTEAGEPDPELPFFGTYTGASVWYRWTAGRTGIAEFNICGSAITNPELDIFTGSSVSSLTWLEHDGLVSGACGAAAGFTGVELGVTSGTTYYLRVSAQYSNGPPAGGAFTIMVDPTPLNDNRASAFTLNLPLSGLASDLGNFLGENIGATAETGEHDHGLVAPSRSVWFDWQAPKTATYVWTTCGSSFDTTLGVEDGSSVIAGSDDAPGLCPNEPDGSALQFSATAGTHYSLAVDGKGGAQGTFALNGPPLNDELPTSGDFVFSLFDVFDSPLQSNTLATHAVGEPTHAGEPASHSLWFQMGQQSSAKIISTCFSNFDTTLEVYRDTNNSSMGSNDDFPGCNGINKKGSVVVVPAENIIYDIVVDGHGGATGNVAVTQRSVQANDAFASASTITPFAAVAPQATASDVNIGESKEAGEPDHAGNAGGKSIWYTYTPAADGPVTLDTCGNSYDTLLAVYTGTDVAALTPVASNDDTNLCGSGKNSAVTFQGLGGTPYKIAVDGKDGDAGFGSLSVNPPPNDSFASPIDLGPLVGQTVAFKSTGSSGEVGETRPTGDPAGASLWYRWTAPADGQATIDNTCAPIHGPSTTWPAVWTGDTIGALTLVAGLDAFVQCPSGGFATSTSWMAHAGTTYRIQLNSNVSAQYPGQFRLNFTPSSTGGGEGGGTPGGGETTTTTTTAVGPTTAGPPPPGPAGPAALAFAGLTLPAHARIADLVGKGLAVRVACTRSCSARGALTVAEPLAKKLHLAKIVTVASGNGSRTRAGTLVLRLRALPKLVKKLRSARALKGTVVVTGAAPGSAPEKLTKPISIKR